jgi:hypothetical protein
VIRREHHAEGREHDVKLAVREWQVLRVSHLGPHRQSVGLSPAPGLIQKLRHVVGGGNVGVATRRRE